MWLHMIRRFVCLPMLRAVLVQLLRSACVEAYSPLLELLLEPDPRHAGCKFASCD